MPRLPRRFVAALLWIAIALLPLRGFAAAVMPALMATAPSSFVSAHAPAGDAAAVHPCHGAELASTDAGTLPADSSHTCSLCDLCHSGVVAAAPQAVALSTPHEVQPRTAAPTAIEPRAPDSLFRPPRTLLA
jgi:hypothetical protein